MDGERLEAVKGCGCVLGFWGTIFAVVGTIALFDPWYAAIAWMVFATGIALILLFGAGR